MGFKCCKVVFVEGALLVSPETLFNRDSAISTFRKGTKDKLCGEVLVVTSFRSQTNEKFCNVVSRRMVFVWAKGGYHLLSSANLKVKKFDHDVTKKFDHGDTHHWVSIIKVWCLCL